MYEFEEKKRGFYFAWDNDNAAVGFSFAAVYLQEQKDFQIVMQIGTLALAVGYSF